MCMHIYYVWMMFDVWMMFGLCLDDMLGDVLDEIMVPYFHINSFLRLFAWQNSFLRFIRQNMQEHTFCIDVATN